MVNAIKQDNIRFYILAIIFAAAIGFISTNSYYSFITKPELEKEYVQHCLSKGLKPISNKKSREFCIDNEGRMYWAGEEK